MAIKYRKKHRLQHALFAVERIQYIKKRDDEVTATYAAVTEHRLLYNVEQ